ncbi:MAG: hypothetical protein D4R48_03645 [Nitrosomonadales bacterium]|nr:MAG: hypothetical protein D4R48_03600 [Nitrosomonadales bacterium]TSA49329.1 MAG: hypothetical protein D4R48_03645 [Nitrosomonadales bacterium]
MTVAPPCQDCIHYYITWDSSFPYGCRAMGFKSRRQPQLEVMEASSTQCMAFALRAGKHPGPK